MIDPDFLPQDTSDPAEFCQLCFSRYGFVKTRVTWHTRNGDYNRCLSCPSPYEDGTVDKPVASKNGVLGL